MRNKGGARLVQRTRNEMRGDGRKKDRKGGEEGISRKGKGQTEGEKNSQKVGERSWGKEEREESSEMPRFFGVSPDFSGNTHWVISCLLKSGQVSNALENGEITLLFPKDIPFPVTSGLEHPSTFLLSPPRGQEGHPQWRQARENTARGVGKSSRIDPRCC